MIYYDILMYIDSNIELYCCIYMYLLCLFCIEIEMWCFDFDVARRRSKVLTFCEDLMAQHGALGKTYGWPVNTKP